jgi:hypothetical protein
MKYLLIKILSIAILLSFSNCKKECEPTNTTCNDTVPTNELCLAYFSRWFYNSSSNKCELIGYSGCSQKGFETEQECEACLCN